MRHDLHPGHFFFPFEYKENSIIDGSIFHFTRTSLTSSKNGHSLMLLQSISWYIQSSLACVGECEREISQSGIVILWIIQMVT